MLRPISASGRTCWIGIRIDEYDKCKWYTTDSKHIEKYWSDLRDDEEFIAIYEAKPSATHYTRIYKSPKEVIGVFEKSELCWTKDYNLQCSKLNDFPETYIKKEETKPDSNAIYLTMHDLESYVFKIQNKNKN